MAPSGLPYGYPPFDKIGNEHYLPAFEQGIAEHLKDAAAVAENPEPATFENTIVALENAGRLLRRISPVFSNLCGCNSNEQMQQIEVSLAPKLAAARDTILMNPAIFARVRALFEKRASLGLDKESLRLLEQYHRRFVRAGAALAEADRARLKSINEKLASLETEFRLRVLRERNQSKVAFAEASELEGMQPGEIESARSPKGGYEVALTNTTGQPALAVLVQRQTRRRILEASLSRGSKGGAFDTRDTVKEIAKLRAERASLLGYANHAAYQLEEQTARSLPSLDRFLERLVPAAVAAARREAAQIQKQIDAEGGGFTLAAWDWDFYSEKVRRAHHAFDEEQLRPYFEVNRVLVDGVFFAAQKLFGITFVRRHDLPVYHPDVEVYEVLEADGRPLSLFVTDFYARPSKQGGAWMNEYVGQSTLYGTMPVIGNHLNVPKPPKGQPTLLKFDHVITLFHEFGHALHGMFSQVRYPYFSGTRVPTDFVEFPSQITEMWAVWPEVVRNYARHHVTGEALPQALLDKVLASQKFNKGFVTLEYLKSTLIDQEWHRLAPGAIPDDIEQFEQQVFRKHGVDFEPVPPRYRSTYMTHSFSSQYSAAYYAYLWADILVADGIEWIASHGGLTRENGDHLRRTVLSRGGSTDARELALEFLGREPDVAALIRRRGFVEGGH